MDDEQAQEEEVSLPFVGDKVSSGRERDLPASIASAFERKERRVGEGTHGSENHLRQPKLRRRDTRNLAKQIEPVPSSRQVPVSEKEGGGGDAPSNGPAHEGALTLRNEVDGGGVETAVRWVGLRA